VASGIHVVVDVEKSYLNCGIRRSVWSAGSKLSELTFVRSLVIQYDTVFFYYNRRQR